MIKGYFHQNGAAFVSANISVPNMDIHDQPLTMLVATGAAASILNPKDAVRMGLAPRDIQRSREQGLPYKATITLKDSEENKSLRFDVETLQLTAPPIHYPGTPSVLGMDVLSRTELHYHPRSGIITITPTPDPASDRT